jgi:hypothetical protein
MSLGNWLWPSSPAPAFLRRIDQLEHHGERRLIRQAALRADRAVPHGGKDALDQSVKVLQIVGAHPAPKALRNGWRIVWAEVRSA